MKNKNLFRDFLFTSERIKGPRSWIDHIPFVKYLIGIKNPKLIVELGTHHGVSFCSMIEAVKFFKIDSKLYAIDTWKGDEHAGFYDEDVYLDLLRYISIKAPQAKLIRSTFDEALNNFNNNSIDILHIDGLHSYEAVKHDFESWLPKLKKDGIILFHDTNVFLNGFGVHVLWEEIKEKYIHYNFEFGFGLGVLSLDIEENSKTNEFIKKLNTDLIYSDYFHLMSNKREISTSYKSLQDNVGSIKSSKFYKFWSFTRNLFGLKEINL